MQQQVSFNTSEKCDLLWTKNSKVAYRELLDKFHIISYIPKLDELLEPDFIQGAILRILNYQKPPKGKKDKQLYMSRYCMENMSSKDYFEADKTYQTLKDQLYKYQGELKCNIDSSELFVIILIEKLLPMANLFFISRLLLKSVYFCICNKMRLW